MIVQAVSHKTAEAIQPAEHSRQLSSQVSSAIRQTQHETWGPNSSCAQRPVHSDHLSAFGTMTIDDTASSDAIQRWCTKPFEELNPPPGLKESEKALAITDNSDYILGTQVGVVKAVYGLGNSVVNMGNAIVSPPARFGDWIANTIVRPDIALHDSAAFGADVGKGIVSGIKAVAATQKYIDDIKVAQAQGNYSKPLTDASKEFQSVAAKFERLTPGQRAAAATEGVVGLGAQVAAGKIFCSAMESVASLMQKMDQFKSKSDAVRAELKLSREAELAARPQPNEKTFAGGKNARFGYEEINAVSCADIPVQCHKNACVAAVGEMLTEGKIDQYKFVKELELYLSPEHRNKESLYALEDLCTELTKQTHLEHKWEWKTVSLKRNIDFEPLFNELLSTDHPFAVTLKVAGQDAHAVVVKGVSEAGHVIIRDPGDGMMYEMIKSEFIEKYWMGQAIARKVGRK